MKNVRLIGEILNTLFHSFFLRILLLGDFLFNFQFSLSRLKMLFFNCLRCHFIIIFYKNQYMGAVAPLAQGVVGLVLVIGFNDKIFNHRKESKNYNHDYESECWK